MSIYAIVYTKEGRHELTFKEWCVFDTNKLHREDGPALFLACIGEYWYHNGNIHREGGPAIKYNDGSQAWYLNDMLHREDGPAYEEDEDKEYWLYDVQYTEEEYHKELNKSNILRML